ncbi:hypothetical protein GCM10009642_03250 [Nocardiopsis metallicus]
MYPVSPQARCTARARGTPGPHSDLGVRNSDPSTMGSAGEGTLSAVARGAVSVPATLSHPLANEALPAKHVE